MKAQDILDALSRSDIVQKIDVIALVEEPGKQALRARASIKSPAPLAQLFNLIAQFCFGA
jgi:hypothetical protein